LPQSEPGNLQSSEEGNQPCQLVILMLEPKLVEKMKIRMKMLRKLL
jgi:hypothetical protein